jgi:hypothetical protein
MVTCHSTAYFMFSCRLSFCTVKSMRLTVLPESASAVFSIRSVHRCPGLCIPAGEQLEECVLGCLRNPYSPNIQMKPVEVPEDLLDNVLWKFCLPQRYRQRSLGHDSDPPTSSLFRAWIGRTSWTLLSQALEESRTSIPVHDVVTGRTILIRANIVKVL